MPASDPDPLAIRDELAAAILGAALRRATFAGPARTGDLRWQRVVIRPLDLRGDRHLQFTYFDGRKTLTQNRPPTEAEASLRELLEADFAGIHVETDREAIDVRTTKKGRRLIGRSQPAAVMPTTLEHNRAKDVPLPEGRADRVLEAMGILTDAGRVRPTMRAKFTQINEFLKHLQHILDHAGLRTLGRPVEILDCGCGASYLTLAVHHYLNDVLHIPARILGVDVNEEVIRKSLAKAESLGTSNLTFACEAIGRGEAKADVVLALHACDTATDDAIARAVRAEARVLLSVPCCHQHLNRQLHAAGPSEVLQPLLRHGILRERTADLVTDTFRSLALRILGYRTEVVEFVNLEHTARNLLIRAVRGAPVGETAFVDEYREMKRFWGVTPYIERVLGEDFRVLIEAPQA